MSKMRQKVRFFSIVVSFLFFPITIFYFSPYLIIEAAGKGIAAGSMLMFVSMLLFAIVFGRLFCGWACPVAGLSEMCFPMNNQPITSPKKWIKFAIWLPWITAIAYAIIRADGLYTIDITYKTSHGISVHKIHLYIIYYSMIMLVMLIILRRGKRAFCHYICWMAPFMIIGSKLADLIRLPRLKLKTQPSYCEHCGTCDSNCTMSLPVSSIVQDGIINHTGCILCGRCADSCEHNVISYTMSNKKM